MIKKVLSVIIGYTIFVISSLALFKFSGVKPHTSASTSFMILTAIYGAFFSFISGVVTRWIAKDLLLNYILAAIIAGFATFSMFKSEGNHWTQLLAIFIFAPISFVGGFFYKNRASR